MEKKRKVITGIHVAMVICVIALVFTTLVLILSLLGKGNTPPRELILPFIACLSSCISVFVVHARRKKAE